MAAPTLRVRPDTAELGRVRRRVSAWAAEAGLDDRAARRLVLAVDEAVANAIEHGLAEGARVVVSGAPRRAPAGHGRLDVTVRYRGPAFDPTAAEAPAPAESVRRRAEHGYGLHLIRALADVAYRRDGDTNEVRLTA